MVSPLRDPTPPSDEAMRRARRLVAQALLPRQPVAEPTAPGISAAAAWLLAIWTATTTVAYISWLIYRAST